MKRFFTNRIIASLLCVCMLLPLCACSKDEPVQKQIFAMDTVMNLTAYGKYANDGISAAVGVINAMDDMLDPSNEGSYTNLINNAEGKDVIVTPQVNEMLSTALSVYKLSGGALDLSVYPLYEAWGEFKDETGRVPSDDEIKELRQKLGFGKTEITDFEGEANYSVRMPAGTQISFGAVAKGCASKYAIDAMHKNGVTSGIVSLGGNVQTLGTKPDGSGWVTGVKDPANTEKFAVKLMLADTSCVTSGSYERYYTVDGVRYHHIIDEATLFPADYYSSLTVVIKDSALADALSTALFCMPYEDSAALAESLGAEVLWIFPDGEIRYTPGMEKLIAN